MPTRRQLIIPNTASRGGLTIRYRQDTDQDAQREDRCRNRDECGAATRALAISLALALGLIVAMVWLVVGPASQEVQAMPGTPLQIAQDQLDGGVIRVATTGEDSPGCGGEDTPCRTVQYAVDQAQAGDEIRVAGGVYSDMPNGQSQMVFVDKTLTIRGGYTTTDWTTSDPAANPTTLDAEGEGRVMVIVPGIEVDLEGLRFQGGNATGLGGGPDDRDAGGGLYIHTATVTISDSVIFSNTASITGTVPGTDLGGGCGGGLYVRGGSLELTHSEIVSNVAGVNVSSFGGGLYLDYGDASISQSKVMSNTASYRKEGYGGGLYLVGPQTQDYRSARLLENTLQGNYGSPTSDGQGGAMYASHYHVELLDNLVQHNTGGSALEGKGGGLYIFFSQALLEHNTIRYNIASRGDEGTTGGAHFCTSPDVTLRNNTIFSNTASTMGNGYGGGVSFCRTTATLESNAIISNTATLSTTDGVRGWGGGVWTGDNASVSFHNDLVAGNHAKTQGSGLWFGVENEPYNNRGHRLYHVTIADNSGDIAHGVYVTHAVAYLTNTIIAGHSNYGVYVSGAGMPEYRGSATLEATLWHENGTDTTGWNIETGDLNYEGDPAFVDPENWDYHIGEGSAALDWGVATGVHTDMDGEPRPWGLPDLGADEVWPPDVAIRAYLPLILRQ